MKVIIWSAQQTLSKKSLIKIKNVKADFRDKTPKSAFYMLLREQLPFYQYTFHIFSIIMKFIHSIYFVIGTTDKKLDFGVFFHQINGAYYGVYLFVCYMRRYNQSHKEECR